MHLHADEVGLAIGAARAGRPELRCRAVWERDALLPLVRCAHPAEPLAQAPAGYPSEPGDIRHGSDDRSCRCVKKRRPNHSGTPLFGITARRSVAASATRWWRASLSDLKPSTVAATARASRGLRASASTPPVIRARDTRGSEWTPGCPVGSSAWELRTNLRQTGRGERSQGDDIDLRLIERMTVNLSTPPKE